MKTHLLIFTIIFSNLCLAQSSTYHPFPDSSATWCEEGVAGGGPCQFFNSVYSIRGDSLINGLVYHRLLCYEYKETRDCSTLQLTFYTYRTWTHHFRQDTVLKKVWILDTSTHLEKIMYDFNLQVGDTLSSSNTLWGDNCADCVISSIDSILIGNDYRKRFNYQSTCMGYHPTDTSMVEGIGGLHSVLYGPSCFEGETALREFSVNQVPLYTNHTYPFFYSACQTFVGISQPEFMFESNIYPNPVQEYFILEVPFQLASQSQLSIFNSFGELIMEEKLYREQNRLNIKNLSSGVYFFQVLTENGKISKGKFVVE